MSAGKGSSPASTQKQANATNRASLKEKRQRPANYYEREPSASHELKGVYEPLRLGRLSIGENLDGKSRPYG
jgi:hypothetical protein